MILQTYESAIRMSRMFVTCHYLCKIVHPNRTVGKLQISLIMDGSGNSGDAELGGPRTPQQAASTKKLQQTQATVDEVVGIMKVNVEKVLERDQKLSELENRADALQQGATQFEQQAGKLKRKYWWKNLKMMIIIGIICVVILIIIIASLVPSSSDPGSS
ncbi:hypothetical protein KM043_011884 [Ampulex compressa]|nr:hypothetical protein KM043_011884 [Ampulex compressa]